MKKIYTQKQLSSYKNFKKNVLARGGIGEILDRKNEQMEFFDALKEKRSGGVTSREMREIIGSFHHKTNDNIDKVETRKLAQEYIGGSRFMVSPKEAKRTDAIMGSRNLQSNDSHGEINSVSNFSSGAKKSFGTSGIRLVR